ncbi:hypothetical protein OSB04_023242 [Centaurea solstitialis]|uniref:Protein FAR1-RELATED SEQUENCE n=1 Tax=Centaurea solstitialis TaxID=347529 RepID=A0AA38SW70_9ASTR|nr:hypothetical protein OSB04_023242 [Centaurea solstitialis]
MATEPSFSIPASSTNVAPNHQTIGIIDSSSEVVQNEELYLANSKFESYDELLKSVRDFYYTKGYGVSIRDSRKDKYVTLQCDRGGSYRDRLGIGDKRKRNTGSRLIECPFRILGKKENDGAWVLKAQNLTHNHEPSMDISGHSSFRRLSSDDIQSVKNMTLSGIPPRQILSSLRQRNQDLPAISRNIYNLKAKIRKENLRNRSMREDEDSYIWALSAFKKTLENREPSVIMSDRELALMNAIKVLFYHTKKVAIEYIKKTWLPWKEKFVSAWTESYLHFGNRSSSRAEGAHAKLKLYLQVSTGGFQEVKEKICLAIKHEFNEIKVKLASERIQVLHKCNVPAFRELLYHVSHFALKEIHMQYEKIEKGTLSPCTGHFTATMGIPCAHKIKHLQGITLSLDLIHPHWRIDTLSLNIEDDSYNDSANKFDELLSELSSRYQMWPLSKKEFATSMINKLLDESDTFFEPMVRRPKGRPPKSKRKRGVSSTTRDPSRFEHVESSQTHNPSSATQVSQTNNEVVENNLLDLNAYPPFSSDDMLFEPSFIGRLSTDLLDFSCPFAHLFSFFTVLIHETLYEFCDFIPSDQNTLVNPHPPSHFPIFNDHLTIWNLINKYGKREHWHPA